MNPQVLSGPDLSTVRQLDMSLREQPSFTTAQRTRLHSLRWSESDCDLRSPTPPSPRPYYEVDAVENAGRLLPHAVLVLHPSAPPEYPRVAIAL